MHQHLFGHPSHVLPFYMKSISMYYYYYYSKKKTPSIIHVIFYVHDDGQMRHISFHLPQWCASTIEYSSYGRFVKSSSSVPIAFSHEDGCCINIMITVFLESLKAMCVWHAILMNIKNKCVMNSYTYSTKMCN